MGEAGGEEEEEESQEEESEEEEEEEEEGEEGPLRGRQAPQGSAQVQEPRGGEQEECREAEGQGTGIFKARSLSADLAKITGKSKMSTGQVVKAVWAYIKRHKLNSGRTIRPDATLGKVVPGSSINMFKMSKHIFKHIK